MAHVIAFFPGSFDPFTRGHEAVVRRILPLFDEVVVAVGCNSDKNPHYNALQREQIIRDMLSDCDNVRVCSYTGMTIDMCHKIGAKVIVRGIRTVADFEYEQTIATVNRRQDPNIETLFVMADAEHRDISSTLEREKLLHSEV